MKTLYEYFTSVYATELDNFTYDRTKETLIKELKENYWVSDLTLSTLLDVSDVINKPLEKTVSILFELKNN